MIEKKELEIFEEKWKQVDDVFVQVLKYSRHPKPENKYKIEKNEYLRLYTIVYDILMVKNAEVRNLCEQRLTSTLKFHCQSLYEDIQTQISVKNFVAKADSYENIVLNFVMKVFSYLERIKCLVQRNKPFERELKEIFKAEIYDKISDLLKKNALEELNKYRRKKINTLDLGSYKKLITFMEYFGDRSFESDIIEDSEKYFLEISKENLGNSYVDYLLFGIEIIQFETLNLTLFLENYTVTTIITKLNEIIFFDNAEKLFSLPDSFNYLLKTKQMNHLKSTFIIFSRSEKTLPLLLSNFKDFVVEKFNEFIQKYSLNTEQGKSLSPQYVAVNTDFLKEFSNFQCFIIDLIMQAFNNNNLFNVVFKETLERIQSNQNNINPSYLLPFYFDKYLKKNSSAEEAKSIIDSAMLIFPFVSEKDIFITLHRNLLSHRLLNEDCCSIEVEKYLLEKLKVQCGNEYINNTETMLKDYLLNKEQIVVQYKDYCEANKIENKIENSFIVLSSENWPTLNVHKMKLTEDLQTLTNQMFKYYHSTFHGRTLQWALQNSMLEIEGKNFVGGNKYTFICNTVQGVILSLFTTFDIRIKREDIITLLNLEDTNDFDTSISGLLQSGLLLKAENGSFMVNFNYTSTNSRVAISNALKDEEVVKKKTDDDRTMAVDGNIMRVIKLKKEIEHNELVTLVLERLNKFNVQINTIKKRIELLIEKELIVRDEKDPNIYKYSALSG